MRRVCDRCGEVGGCTALGPVTIPRDQFDYGSALTQGLTVQDVHDWPGVLKSVTGEDILAAAELVFDRKSSVTGYLKGVERKQVTQ